MRVFDDEPGFALLEFGWTLEASKIKISVRNLSEPDKGYLWPGGTWSKAPYYFDAERTSSETGPARYRVGPDIVNHLSENTLIEVTAKEGDLKESGYWENAIPQMASHGPSYTLLQPSVFARKTETAPASAATPPPQQEQPLPRRQDTAPPPSPPRQFPVRRSWPLAWRLLLIAIFAGASAFVISMSWRCTLFGFGCPADVAFEDAMRCATKKLGHAPCEVDACFGDYRRGLGARTAKQETANILALAKEACAALPGPPPKHGPRPNDAAYADARACAEANPCNAAACFDTYLRLFGESGLDRSRAEADLTKARKSCPVPEPNPGPTLEDGEYSGFASAGCAAPGQPVTVTIGRGAICWRHDRPLITGGVPVEHGWQGRIGPSGAIQATVPGMAGTSANGRYDETDNQVHMRYPGCDNYVTLTIRQLRKRLGQSPACAAN
ncbi:MAG: hypothetical protein L0Y50_08275 [Beijerinckiaceae bacterium]|nr:hypothetical protein [Beijerinckiaceae bacterium]